MVSQKSLRLYSGILVLLLIPIVLAWVLSLFLNTSEPTPIVKKSEITDNQSADKEVEQQIQNILNRYNMSLDGELDELFDQVFERWMAGGQNPDDLDKMAEELSQTLEKSHLKDNLKLPYFEQQSWAEEKLILLKQANQHPIDISLEHCVEENPDSFGRCFLAHIQLWEKDLKNHYDIILTKINGKTRQDFITAQESWYNHMMTEQNLAESMLSKKKSDQELAQDRMDILFKILQTVKARSLELEALKEKL